MTNRFAQFKVFSMVYGVAYTLFFYYNWAPFRYYPAVEKFTLHPLPAAEAGPAILYYGWVAAGFVVAALIALLTPRKLADKIWHGAVWIVPALLLLAILIYERRWFV